MRPWLVALALFCLISLPGWGQQNESSPAAAFRADSTLVLIPVSVTDPSNRYVLGLEKQDFSVLEDDTQQTIAHFSSEDAPLSVGLLVDTSGSMGDKLETSRQAVKEFLKTLDAPDEAFLVEFSDQAQLAAPFTSDTSAIEDKLKVSRPAGLTALLDAVHLGLQEMKNARNPRRALLIVSDGGDNNSRYTALQIQELVREADVQIYAMGVFEPVLLRLTSAELGGPGLLSQLSEQTGGRALAAANAEDLPLLAQRIGVELRNQYVLAYAPKNGTRDGKYRKVDVQLHPPDGLPQLKARWRPGYYAPAQ